jgi:sporulation protein YqfC
VERFFINQINNNRVVIGGVRGLSEFTPEMVVVKVINGIVHVTGSGLKIARFDENEIEIVGVVENVETVSSRKRSV